MAALPRMLYGMARENLVPKFFGNLHPKYRVPMWGLVFTVFLMLLTTVYITIQGGSSDVITMFINMACITWLVTYCIAMIDVHVLRKKYPDFPRLWKAPAAKIVMPIGILGAPSMRFLPWRMYCPRLVLSWPLWRSMPLSGIRPTRSPLMRLFRWRLT